MFSNGWLAWYADSAFACEPVPWWLRAQEPAPWAGVCPLRGWFVDAYPDLMPYYPLPAASPDWFDPWSLHGYTGYWWH
ncbi:MAG: hypothetical protein K6T30_03070 [Alicyclobacillus sp.]|nr:hypothetical protein [Alicyclobacillus sp.]